MTARTPLNVPARLRTIAAARPHHMVLRDDSGDVTYRELIDAMDGTAAALNRAGVAAGDRVAIAMESSNVYIAFVLACLAAGVVPVPLNTRLTSGESRRLLETIGPTFILHDETFADLAAGTGYETQLLEGACRPGELASRMGPYAATPVVIPAQPEDAPAIIFATGGTTGVPKGVFYDHRGMWLWMNASASSMGGSRFDIELYISPLFHVALGTTLISRLFSGGAIWMPRSFDPETALAAIGRGCTRLAAAATVYAMLREHPHFGETDRTSVKGIRLGAMPAQPDFILEVMRDYPNAAVGHGYGATEFGSVAGVEHGDFLAGRVNGIGRPHPGAEVRILRADGSQAEAGEVGEVVVRCPWQSSGYWGKPDETAETYREEGIWIGDLGVADEDGWLTISGRRKEMIITGGENVFPTEVEIALRRHPGLSDVIVYGMRDERWGERVEVAVVPHEGVEVTLEDLRKFGRSDLAGYKLPKTMRLIDEIPMTGTQKPDRRLVREQSEREATAARSS